MNIFRSTVFSFSFSCLNDVSTVVLRQESFTSKAAINAALLAGHTIFPWRVSCSGRPNPTNSPACQSTSRQQNFWTYQHPGNYRPPGDVSKGGKSASLGDFRWPVPAQVPIRALEEGVGRVDTRATSLHQGRQGREHNRAIFPAVDPSHRC